MIKAKVVTQPIKAKVQDDKLTAKVLTMPRPVRLQIPTISTENGVVTASITLEADTYAQSGTVSTTYTPKTLYYGSTQPSTYKKGDRWLRGNEWYICRTMPPIAADWEEVTVDEALERDMIATIKETSIEPTE